MTSDPHADFTLASLARIVGQAAFSRGSRYAESGAVAGIDWLVGSQQQIVQLPSWLQGRFEVAGVGIGRYRLFIVAVCAVLTVLLVGAALSTAATSSRRVAGAILITLPGNTSN